MNKKIIILLTIILLLLISIGIIINKNATKLEQEEHKNFKILTTFYPIYIMTENIIQGAQDIELVNMTDVNIGCLHDYTLTSADMKKLESADVIIENGLGLESFMDKVLNSYSDIKIIDSSNKINNTIEENGKINNHVWTSITNYILQVEEITNQLIRINPENASIYTKNKEEYIQKLQKLQGEYRKQLEDLKGEKAICLNEALTYLAKEVGLDVTSIETDHEESSLSAETMKQLINKMKEENITTILVDDTDFLKSANTLANETKSKIYTIKSGLRGNGNKEEYIEIMKENLEQLKLIKKHY